MFRYFCFLFVLLFLPVTAFADIAGHFPELTGHVVDQAGIFSPQSAKELERALAEHESQTTNQVVVVTLDSLHGYPVEDFALELGRHWKLGQADKNNGLLLLVAPRERKTRIEVGYGLEGALTDAICHDILQRVMIPAFKAGKYEQGIIQGAQAVLQGIAGEYSVEDTESHLSDEEDTVLGIIFTLFLFSLFLGLFLNSHDLLAPLGTICIVLAVSSLTGSLFCYPWIRFIFSPAVSLVVSGAVSLGTLIFSCWLVREFRAAPASSGSGSRSSSSYYRGSSSSYSSSSYSSSSYSSSSYSGGGGSFGGGGASGSW